MPLYEIGPGFHARKNNGVAFLEGELEAETAESARAVLRAVVGRANEQVVIDLSALTFSRTPPGSA